MKNNIKRFCLYWLSVLCTFLLLQKPLFMLMNNHHGGTAFSCSDLWQIYAHGIKLDIATTGYITALPLLILLAGSLIRKFHPEPLMKVWNGIAAFLISIGTLADASLYEFWEFKLDNTVFMYINDPKNAFASVSVWYVLWRAAVVILMTFFLYIIYNKVLISKKAQTSARWFIALPVYILLGGLLFAGIRGIEIWPNTPSIAYYSKTQFFNHCAVNPVFNVVYSLSHRSDFRRDMRFMNDKEVDRIVPPLFPTGGKSECILKTQRPNILFIIIEGMGSLFIDDLNNPDRLVAASTGELPRDVAPRLSRLMQEGMSWDQCYGGSFRTDRGVVCALSGYLGQPTTSIMRYSKKVDTLPGLPKTLKKYGYETEILYASDITFFNMSNYFLACGHDKLVSQDNFPVSERTTKWGVPDHVACQWLLKDIENKTRHHEQWYTTFLTISSHTPFDVPYNKKKDKMLNGFAYTDNCIGDLIDALKKFPAWDNMLVIVTADHGFNHREIASENFPLIPFLLTGGAVKQTQRIHTPCSQTDIPATILGQLGIPHKDFMFSRDVLADTYTEPFAFNTFNNGFNFRDSTGVTVFDNDTKKAILGADKTRELKGKAILQYLYNDLDKR